jgi:hypothetical protein
MNERYRYGYGDEPGEREPTSSRQGSMTDQRADADQDVAAGDEEDEDRRADRIREADSETQAARTGTAAGDEPVEPAEAPVSIASSSVFEVEEEATGAAHTPTGEPDRADTGPQREAAGEARTAEPAGDTQERPPIALGPPSRTTDEAPATATPAADLDGQPAEAPADGERTSIFETAGTAKPEAATPRTGTPTDETPAAVSTGVEALEPDQAGQRPQGTETEMLVPGSGPAPVAAPVDRSALLGSIDADAIRARFLDIQAGFVDEPRQAVQEAERFVDEMVQDLVKALENERAKLKGAIEGGSTEDLRIALRGYRAFVERLLNLSM